jgi:hypothetical protein
MFSICVLLRPGLAAMTSAATAPAIGAENDVPLTDA